MKYLRWQGAASFFVIIAVIALLFYMFAELIIKKGIETSVSWYTKAEVNVQAVDLKYSPLTLKVKGFQATDAEQPTHNLIAFDEAGADISLWHYLLGKIIIQELDVKGLSFSTLRKSEGEVYEKSEQDTLEPELAENSPIEDIKANLPDPKTLLDNADLQTLKAGETLTASYATEAEKLKGIKSTLPTKETLDGYKEQVEALSKIKITSLADVEMVKNKYNELKKQFNADKQAIKAAKEQVLASKNIIAKDVTALKNAPAQDWQEIESKYQLDSLEGGDFAHLLFGEDARKYYDNIALVYEKLSPLLAGSESPEKVEKESATGRFVYFTEDNPLPELLIHQIYVSIKSTQGDFVMDITEFNYQHWLRNKPTVYKLSSSNITDSGSASLLGNLTTIQQGGFTTDGQWSLNNMTLSNIALRETDDLSLTLNKGSLFAKGGYQATNETIDSNNSFALKQGDYAGNATNQISKLVLNTLSKTEELSVGVGVKGSVFAPSLSISSDLDNILKDAVSQQVDEKLTEFKSSIQSGLNDKLSDSLNVESEGKTDLLNLESLLNDSENTLDNLLSSDVVKQQQGQLKNKAKDKLKDKLGGFFK